MPRGEGTSSLGLLVELEADRLRVDLVARRAAGQVLLDTRRLGVRKPPLDVGGDRRRPGVPVFPRHVVDPVVTIHLPATAPRPSRWTDAVRIVPGWVRPAAPRRRGRRPSRERTGAPARPGTDTLRFEVGTETLHQEVPPPVEPLLVLAERPRDLRDAHPGLHVQAQKEPFAGRQARQRPPDRRERPVGQRLALVALRRGRAGLRRLRAGARPRPPRARREPQAQRVERVARLRDVRVALQHAARFVEAQPVAVEQPLQAQRDRAEAARLRRRPPLAEAADLEVEVQPVDDRDEVRLQRAATLEAREDLVVVLDQPGLHDRREVLGVRSPQAAPRAHPDDHPVDDRQLREELLLAGHALSRCGMSGSLGCWLRRSYDGAARRARRRRAGGARV